VCHQLKVCVADVWHTIYTLCFAWESIRRARLRSKPKIVKLWCPTWSLGFRFRLEKYFQVYVDFHFVTYRLGFVNISEHLARSGYKSLIKSQNEAHNLRRSQHCACWGYYPRLSEGGSNPNKKLPHMERLSRRFNMAEHRYTWKDCQGDLTSLNTVNFCTWSRPYQRETFEPSSPGFILEKKGCFLALHTIPLIVHTPCVVTMCGKEGGGGQECTGSLICIYDPFDCTHTVSEKGGKKNRDTGSIVCVNSPLHCTHTLCFACARKKKRLQDHLQRPWPLSRTRNSHPRVTPAPPSPSKGPATLLKTRS